MSEGTNPRFRLLAGKSGRPCPCEVHAENRIRSAKLRKVRSGDSRGRCTLLSGWNLFGYERLGYPVRVDALFDGDRTDIAARVQVDDGVLIQVTSLGHRSPSKTQ